MANRGEQFNAFANFDFAELTKIKFKKGCEPRNATDYYYHSNTKTIYSYYWADNPGSWTDDQILDTNNIETPYIVSPILFKFGMEKNNKQKPKKLNSEVRRCSIL
jgi:hypothetical protein